MYNDYLSTKRLMCNVKMCQVVKISTLCICIHILYQKDEGCKKLPISQKFTKCK